MSLIQCIWAFYTWHFLRPGKCQSDFRASLHYNCNGNFIMHWNITFHHNCI